MHTMQTARSAPVLLGLFLLLVACGIPRDPEGTTARVRSSSTIRLGEVAGAPPDAHARAVLAELSSSTGARIERHQGHGEALLEALQAGELDLVYGRFADDSPWMSHVHLGERTDSAADPPPSMRVPRFAYRNGENGWIALVEDRVAR